MALTPPEGPEIERRLKFFRVQAIALPMIALVPLLGALKVFDSSRGLVQSRGGVAALSVRYPERLRDRTFEPLEITVENLSSETWSKAVVEFDREYLSQFREVQFSPDMDEVDENSLVFELHEVEPGETRNILATYEADETGSHPAKVRVKTDKGDESEVTFSTFVLP